MLRTLSISVAVALAAAVALWATVSPDALATALTAQQEKVQTEPGDPAAWNDLGNLLVLAQAPEAAAEAYHHAIQLDPDRTSPYFNLGLLLLQAGEWRQAAEQFSEVLDRDPRHAWAWFELGMAREGAGRERAAVEAYQRAFVLEPQLTFVDVNPQILGSELVGRALLRASSRAAVGAAAPRRYEEPGRITDLLLPRLPDEAEGTSSDAPPGTPAAAAAEAERRLPRQWEGQGAGPAPGAGSGDEEWGDLQVLTPADLARQRGGDPAGAGQPAGARDRTIVVPAPGTPRQPGTTPGRNDSPSQGGFRPGADSTGRVELRND